VLALCENVVQVDKYISSLRASDFKQSATREDQVRNVDFMQKRVREERTQIEAKWL
jgi:tRNA A58 N-methylase Trm61